MIFEWDKVTSWKRLFLEDNTDILGDEFFSKYISAGRPRIYEDVLIKLAPYIAGPIDEALDLIYSRFYRRFAKVRAYHGCAPANTDTYYLKGINPLDTGAIHTEIRKEFLNGSYPELSSALVERAIENARPGVSPDSVYLALDSRTFIEDCGHYIRYGSEYRVGIAANLVQLTSGRDYRLAFRDKGMPTIFVCDIPAAVIEESDKRELLAKVIVAALGCDPDSHYEKNPIDFTIELHQPVKKEWITRHYHPSYIKDPLNRT